ncbi:MAG: hypothetical protein ABEI27_02335 [Halobellus sp.]|uniref:hypothetical protein n=1 Tax=Halobellus sp. TaxID=1979212 RepID=UPI0035D4B024
MTEGREQAWRIAVVRTDLDAPPILAATRWLLRATATGGAFFIRGPKLDPTLVDALRTVETEAVDLTAVHDGVQKHLDTTQ